MTYGLCASLEPECLGFNAVLRNYRTGIQARIVLFITVKFLICIQNKMQVLQRIVSRNPPSSYYSSESTLSKFFSIPSLKHLLNSRVYSSDSKNRGDNDDKLPWDTSVGSNEKSVWDDSASSWSTGLTKDLIDGEAVGHRVSPLPAAGGGDSVSKQGSVSPRGSIGKGGRQHWGDFKKEARQGWNKLGKEDVISDEEASLLMKQIRSPGARGSYLKDSDKTEMYRLHKENPELYTVEKLAQDFRILRQRVVAILWLKEQEEEEEKKRGEPLDDSVELLLDTFPE